MRFKSNKRARQDRPAIPLRAEFLREHRRCWVCWRGSTEVHEIASGNSFRVIAFREPCAWFSACTGCNQGPLCDYAQWPIVRQLAIKFVCDRGRFDLVRFNVDVRGRAAGAITMEELQPWIDRDR